MSHRRPNILLITTDQQRGDHLGIAGHPFLQTPNLDYLARSGSYFQRAYSECPSCVPARRTLLSGMSPVTQGMVGYKDYEPWNPPHTFAGLLSDAGYQSELIGKLHLFPYRKRYGFEHLRWADATHPWGDVTNDYLDWLRTSGAVPLEAFGLNAGMAHGVSANSWVGRPNFLPEHLTHSFWCASQAIDFFQRRDPESPFFMYLSFIDPHPPLTPPRAHYDRYVNLPLPAPVVGDWAPKFDGPEKGLDPNASVLSLDEQTMRYCKAAYCGLINHVDDQIGRVLDVLARRGLLNDTFILFTSDHGEMLGDHNLFRKCHAYEGSARVPMLAKAPSWMEPASGVTSSLPVGLQDVAPTLLDAAGISPPSTMTGRSLLPVMRKEKITWRDALHGEHSPCYAGIEGMQFLTDGTHKYIWHTKSGREQLFNLQDDPNELHDLARVTSNEPALLRWRERMIRQLTNRPEGFTDGHRLIAGRTHTPMVPARV